MKLSKQNCKEWKKNKLKNPKTNRKIKKNGPVYKKINKQCKSSSKSKRGKKSKRIKKYKKEIEKYKREIKKYKKEIEKYKREIKKYKKEIEKYKVEIEKYKKIPKKVSPKKKIPKKVSPKKKIPKKVSPKKKIPKKVSPKKSKTIKEVMSWLRSLQRLSGNGEITGELREKYESMYTTTLIRALKEDLTEGDRKIIKSMYDSHIKNMRQKMKNKFRKKPKKISSKANIAKLEKLLKIIDRDISNTKLHENYRINRTKNKMKTPPKQSSKKYVSISKKKGNTYSKPITSIGKHYVKRYDKKYG